MRTSSTSNTPLASNRPVRYPGIGRNGSAQDDRRERDFDLLPVMPVLDYLHAELGGLHESVRSLFGLQHLFGSTTSLIHRITEGRIDPSEVFLLGKPYSANRRVMEFQREELGFWVHPKSCDQPLGKDNDGEMDGRVEQVLDSIRGRLKARHDGDGRVLLIDDGGRAIRMLHTDRYADIRDRFTCVEQTRCGIRTIEDLTLRISVINVAESWVKLDHESPMIADSVIHELCKKLRAMDSAGIPTGNRALIIGFGTIGRAVGAALRGRGRDVAIYDTQESQRRLAKRDGYSLYDDLHSALRRGGLIIGCTGKPVLDHADYTRIREGTILISASSADVEFRAWQLRTDAECLGKPEGWDMADGDRPSDLESDPNRNHPCFSLYRVSSGRRRFYLINGGFPVNFDGGVDPIVPEKIQLTRSLLYLGALQASYSQQPGLHDLDGRLQRMLLDAFTAASERQAA